MQYFALFVILSFSAYSSEAIRYARHGCEVRKSQVACNISDRLTGKTKKKISPTPQKAKSPQVTPEEMKKVVFEKPRLEFI